MKWWFACASLLLFIIGLVSYLVRGGFNYGIDFTGGTVIVIKFKEAPDTDRLRNVVKSELEGESAPILQRYGTEDSNTVQVRIQKALGTGEAYEDNRKNLVLALRKVFDPNHEASGLTDFNNMGASALKSYLIANDPDNVREQGKNIQETETYYNGLAEKILNYRNKEADGLLSSLDVLKNIGVSDATVASLSKNFYTGTFAVKSLESIGAVVGSDLRKRALYAVGFSLLAMGVYIAFRFKLAYGIAAIVALFHDVIITLGLFALTQKEISLTVIAALLTLVGYSINDTIVIFDRVRENLRTMRKESLHDILNLSINQTLSRTILTSGFTFLAAISLFLFGGEVLNGFSFALAAGIILGTYSSFALASAIVELWYQNENKPKRKTV